MKRFHFLFVLLGGLILSLPFLSFVENKSFSKATFLKAENESQWAKEQLSKMTLEEKIGQFFMITVSPTKGEEHFKEVESIISKHKIGGLIFFKGSRDTILELEKRYALDSKLPLFHAIDAEWGLAMRMDEEWRFPYAYSLGAANDPVLTKKVAEAMAEECKSLNIHINFAPVADVHSDPDNPIIGFRSFGENPEEVGDHVKAMVEGMEEHGVMTSLKHFPGHGNTDKDSHLELPTVSSTYKDLDAIDWFPFREGIRAGAGSVMVGHLNVSVLDQGISSSLSSKIIRQHLKEELGFEGLVISDALDMKGVSKDYDKTEVVVKAFQAGCDILLMPESIEKSIAAIINLVEKGDIDIKEIDERCLKILQAKDHYINKKRKNTRLSIGEKNWLNNQVFEKAISVVKNEENLLPLKDLSNDILHIELGADGFVFREMLDNITKVDHGKFNDCYEAAASLKGKNNYKTIIISLHATTVRSRDNFGLPHDLNSFLSSFPKDVKKIVALFGNPLYLRGNNITNADAIIIGYENSDQVQDRLAQLIFGNIAANGSLPITVSESFPRRLGLKFEALGRLKFSQPEEFGIDPNKFNRIDSIANEGIKAGAFPGCQIVAALDGKIIYRKSFGFFTYDSAHSVVNSDLYDIASITKIASSTLSAMKLESEHKLSLDSTLKAYIPEVTGPLGYGNIRLKDMMAHQAGLPAWIPFYTKTMLDGRWDPSVYDTYQHDNYNLRVTENLWMNEDYIDKIYSSIMSNTLAAKKYKYSDLGYYFLKKIIEKETKMNLDSFVENEVYHKLGIYSLCYNPLRNKSIEKIAPTEEDKVFRKTLVHGYVHDPGAAMLGGVGGHAGLFSNATDLAKLMQLYLQDGAYGGVQILSSEVVKRYTKKQFSENRRGAGFDRPKDEGGGTCHEVASQKSYGHSGFTGTLAWADPETGINYVFLSNRVYPDAENWKIVKMNTRTEIQKVIYDAVKSRKF